MKIFVQVKTGARVEALKKLDDTSYAISVKAHPIDGKANGALIQMLAKYFDVSKSRIEIVLGHTSTRKIVNIDR